MKRFSLKGLATRVRAGARWKAACAARSIAGFLRDRLRPEIALFCVVFGLFSCLAALALDDAGLVLTRRDIFKEFRHLADWKLFLFEALVAFAFVGLPATLAGVLWGPRKGRFLVSSTVFVLFWNAFNLVFLGMQLYLYAKIELALRSPPDPSIPVEAFREIQQQQFMPPLRHALEELGYGGSIALAACAVALLLSLAAFKAASAFEPRDTKWAPLNRLQSSHVARVLTLVLLTLMLTTAFVARVSHDIRVDAVAASVDGLELEVGQSETTGWITGWMSGLRMTGHVDTMIWGAPGQSLIELEDKRSAGTQGTARSAVQLFGMPLKEVENHRIRAIRLRGVATDAVLMRNRSGAPVEQTVDMHTGGSFATVKPGGEFEWMAGREFDNAHRLMFAAVASMPGFEAMASELQVFVWGPKEMAFRCLSMNTLPTAAYDGNFEITFYLEPGTYLVCESDEAPDAVGPRHISRAVRIDLGDGVGMRARPIEGQDDIRGMMTYLGDFRLQTRLVQISGGPNARVRVPEGASPADGWLATRFSADTGDVRFDTTENVTLRRDRLSVGGTDLVLDISPNSATVTGSAALVKIGDKTFGGRGISLCLALIAALGALSIIPEALKMVRNLPRLNRPAT